MYVAATCSPYGWKARIGLIVPSTNTNNEAEFWRMAPRGVTIQTSRVLATGPSTKDAFVRMEEALDLATQQLATAEVDIVAYGCTTGSIVCPLPALIAKMSQTASVPALTTAAAVVAALRAMGIKHVAVGTPYNDYLNDSEKIFLQEYGFEITTLNTLEFGDGGERRRIIGRVPPEAIYRLAVAIDSPKAEGIFISCTNLATIDVIAEIESELGKPVITSNQATFWACLRMLGIKTSIPGYGRLLEECLAPIDASHFGVIATTNRPLQLAARPNAS